MHCSAQPHVFSGLWPVVSWQTLELLVVRSSPGDLGEGVKQQLQEGEAELLLPAHLTSPLSFPELTFPMQQNQCCNLRHSLSHCFWRSPAPTLPAPLFFFFLEGDAIRPSIRGQGLELYSSSALLSQLLFPAWPAPGSGPWTSTHCCPYG